MDAGLKRENRALALIDKAAQFATAAVKSLESVRLNHASIESL